MKMFSFEKHKQSTVNNEMVWLNGVKKNVVLSWLVNEMK